MKKPKKFVLDTSGIDAAEEQLNDIQKAVDNRNQVYAEACVDSTPYVQQQLLQSLQSSGIKSHSGELKKNVGRSELVPTKKFLLIRMPKSLAKDSYVKASSLNYGATHRSGVKSEKVRQTLKRGAMAAEALAIKEGIISGPQGKSIKGDGYWVTRAFDFFKLPSQASYDTLNARFGDAFKKVFEKIKSKYQPSKSKRGE